MAKKVIKETIHAKGFDISIYTTDFENEFISLTDIAKYKSNAPNDVIKNWMRSRETLEFLGLWETLHNPDFKPVEFDGFRTQAGLNAFTMSPTKWITGVNAIGIQTKAGRYGGTYAHYDIAMEFASWVSAEFKLYLVKDYRRLKSDENSRLSLSWNLNREIAKLNYRIHTDAIKENLIPPELTPAQIAFTYADEADLLNVALFGMTAKQWRAANPKKKGNLRDGADLKQLLVLANMESYNAILIEQVLLNLFDNVTSHAKDADRIWLHIEQTEHSVRLSVEDNGQDLPESRILSFLPEGASPRIDDGTSTDASRNMGIGLSVCRSIIRAHGGDMTAEKSIRHGGVKISFALPLGEEEA